MCLFVVFCFWNVSKGKQHLNKCKQHVSHPDRCTSTSHQVVQAMDLRITKQLGLYICIRIYIYTSRYEKSMDKNVIPLLRSWFHLIFFWVCDEYRGWFGKHLYQYLRIGWPPQESNEQWPIQPKKSWRICFDCGWSNFTGGFSWGMRFVWVE